MAIGAIRDVIKEFPLTTAFDGPWKWLEEKGLSQNSILADPSKEKIHATLARVCFGILLPYIAKPAAWCNLGIGAVHLSFLGYALIQRKEIDRKELQKAFIHVAAGVYDLALAYLSGLVLVRIALIAGIALLPNYVNRVHRFIFATAPTAQPATPNAPNAPPPDHILDPGCFIEKTTKTLAIICRPPPERSYWAWLASYFVTKKPTP